MQIYKPPRKPKRKGIKGLLRIFLLFGVALSLIFLFWRHEPTTTSETAKEPPQTEQTPAKEPQFDW